MSVRIKHMQHITHVILDISIVRRLVSVSNVQVLKSQKFEYRIPQRFCIVLILDTFQFISEELIEKEIEGRIGND